MKSSAIMALSFSVSSVAFLHSMESSHISCFSVGTPSFLIFSSSWVRDIWYFFLKRLAISLYSFRKIKEISLRRKLRVLFLGVTILSVSLASINFMRFYMHYISWVVFPPYPIPKGSFYPVHPIVIVNIFKSLLIAGLFGIAERSISLLLRTR